VAGVSSQPLLRRYFARKASPSSVSRVVAEVVAVVAVEARDWSCWRSFWEVGS